MMVLAALGGYVLGSVPFGLVLTRAAGLGDIRQIGSGNIGATNVLRTGRKGLSLAGEQAMLVAGFAAVLGHNFPVWLKFKGGKGVATTLGTLIAASPFTGLACCLTWLVVARLFRISSLSALVALAAAPVFAWFISGPDYAAMAGGLAVLGFVRHHANIRRLLRGEEPRIAAKKKPA